MNLTAAQIDRACGVILGAAVGDALGAGYEFGSAPLGPDGPGMIGGGLGGFAPGEWTDDTSMTACVLSVAATGADLRSTEALDAIAAAFWAWYDSHPADIGIQTSSVLRAAGPNLSGFSLTAAAFDHYASGARSAGNGSLMRTSPVALAHLDDPEALVEAAMKVSALTHADPLAQEACALWCLAVRHAVNNGSFDVEAGLAYLPVESQPFWRARLNECHVESPKRFNPNSYTVTALQAAWSAILATPVPEDSPCGHLVASLTTAIAIGHDTDTVASIAGALLGARWGMSAIPSAWRRILHGYPGWNALELERLAYLAARRGAAGKYGWPSVEHIDYSSLQYGTLALAVHPYDDGVLLAGATVLSDALDVDVVLSLCLTGSAQVAPHLEHITFRLLDEPDPASNPNLDFVLLDAARTVSQLRDEGKRVLLHCVAAHSRTPTVAIAYAMLRGAPLDEATSAVRRVLPGSDPHSGFRAALRRLGAAIKASGLSRI